VEAVPAVARGRLRTTRLDRLRAEGRRSGVISGAFAEPARPWRDFRPQPPQATV
jgi:hypothetical protein